MTGAELKTLRESLGLSVAWLAANAVSPRTGEPVGERTVRYWESGNVPIPADVSALLDRVEAIVGRGVAQAIHQVEQTQARMRKKHGDDAELDGIDLCRYATDAELWRAHPDFRPLPATCHAAMLARIKRALAERGIGAVIDYAH